MRGKEARTEGKGARLTSDDGQLGGDGHLPLAVARHALVGVLIPRRSERLDPQHGAGALVKLDGLDGRGIAEGTKRNQTRPKKNHASHYFSGANS